VFGRFGLFGLAIRRGLTRPSFRAIRAWPSDQCLKTGGFCLPLDEEIKNSSGTRVC